MMTKLAVVCALFLLGSGCAEPEELGEPANPATSVASGVAEHPPRLVFYNRGQQGRARMAAMHPQRRLQCDTASRLSCERHPPELVGLDDLAMR